MSQRAATNPAARRVATITAAAKAAGLLRTLVSARVLGATSFADAYTAANTVPNVLVDVVANGITNAAIVPLQASLSATEGEAEADRALSAMLSWILVITVPLAVIAILLRSPIARVLLGSAHDPAQRAIAARMLVILLLQIPLYAVGVVVSSALQARRRFTLPAVAPLLSSVVVIATYLIFAAVSPGRQVGSVSTGAQYLLVVGTTVGVIVLTVPLLIPLLRAGVRLRPTLRLRPDEVTDVMRLGAAGLAALLAEQLATVVLLRLSSARPGGVMIVTLALTMLLMPFELIAVPLATTSLPELSSRIALGELDEFAKLSRSVVTRGRSFSVIAALLVAVLSPVGAYVLLEASPGLHGSVGQLALTVALGSPAIVGMTVAFLASRTHFARRSWRWAAVSGGGGWVLTAAAALLVAPQVSSSDRLPALGLSLSVGFLLLYAALAAAGRTGAA